MSTNVDEVRRRLGLRLDGAEKVLNGFKKEIADDIRRDVQTFMNKASQGFNQQVTTSTQNLEQYLRAATDTAVEQLSGRFAAERKKLEDELRFRQKIIVALSCAAFLLSLVALILLLLLKG